MSIASRAVKESKDVARLAVDAAKSELIEQLTPAIKAIIDGQLRAGTLGQDVATLEGVNRMRQAADYDGISDFEEGKDMAKDKKDKVESVSALFPGVNELREGEEEMDEGAEEEMDEAAQDAGHSGEDHEVAESFELSESELEAMYAEALQLEVDVKKGFSDIARPHELGAGAKYDSTKEPASLQDMKPGEHDWESDAALPPAKKDMVPESKRIRAMVKEGVAENKRLVAQNAKLTETVQKLYSKLQEMNLLNSKILHVNRFMSAHRLTTEQKKAVIESIDKGQTVKEVKNIFSILESSFKAAGTVSEGARRAPRADSQKRRTTGAPDPRVLRESADREEGTGYSRLQTLAGLNKLVGG